MLFLLSPAKKLDYNTPLLIQEHTQPLFIEEAKILIEVLRRYSAKDIADLMQLSENLANLNVQRYAEWQETFSFDNARQALLAFNGDVYEGLDAHRLDLAQLQWAQEHLCILSGLYGVLRPLDLMQAYRLEMGTRLENPKGKTLYAYWKNHIAPYLNQRLTEQSSNIIINLASEEYFKAVDLKQLNAKVVQCVFQDEKNGQYKVISFHAKRARGLMARFAITQKAQTPDDLKAFNLEGYHYAPEVSSDTQLVFRRKAQC